MCGSCRNSLSYLSERFARARCAFTARGVCNVLVLKVLRIDPARNPCNDGYFFRLLMIRGTSYRGALVSGPSAFETTK